jgi:hypothetical protein
LTVGKKNELEWELRLPDKHPLTPGDCIEFVVDSKYEDKEYYKSFDTTKSPTCQYKEGPNKASCSIIDY